MIKATSNRTRTPSSRLLQLAVVVPQLPWLPLRLRLRLRLPFAGDFEGEWLGFVALVFEPDLRSPFRCADRLRERDFADPERLRGVRDRDLEPPRERERERDRERDPPR